MPKYQVHVYPVVRVLVPDIEADSPEEGCQKAEQALDFNNLFSQPGIEYADDIDGFLVDEDGDTEHHRSASYDANYVRQEF
jgi:hypothetical protein